MPKFPRPNMSGYIPNLAGRGEGNGFDIGWIEGEFNDGRPYRAELWCWDHNSIITFFFSSLELENASDQEFADLLDRETPFKAEARKLIIPIKIQDFSGNELWAVNIFFGGNKPLPIRILRARFTPYQKIRRISKGGGGRRGKANLLEKGRRGEKGGIPLFEKEGLGEI